MRGSDQCYGRHLTAAARWMIRGQSKIRWLPEYVEEPSVYKRGKDALAKKNDQIQRRYDSSPYRDRPKAARRCHPQSRAGAGGRQGCVQRRRPGCEPGRPSPNGPVSESERSTGTFRGARICSRRCTAARWNSSAISQSSLKSERRSGRGVAALAAGPMSNWWPPRRACSRRCSLAAYGTSELYAYSFERLDQSGRRVAGTRGRGRRDPRRYQRGGRTARLDRHLPFARSAGLADQRAAAGRCIRRWPARPRR